MSEVILALVSNISLWVLMLFGVLLITAAIVKHQGQLPSSSPLTAIRRFVICTVLAVIIIGSANYLINPLGAYPTRFLEPVADHTRADKIQLLQQLPSPAELIILGSSRSMNIRPSDIQRATGLSAFNAGVDVGIPRDYLGFALYLEGHNRLPKIFLVGLGLEQMSESDQEAKYEFFDPLDTYLPSNNPLPSVLDIEQTQATFRQIGAIVAGQYISDPLVRLRKLYVDNGSISFDSTPELTEESVTSFLSAKPDFPGKVSDQQVDHLRSFMELCQKHDIRLIIYFPPYHPRVLTYYQQNTAFPTMEQKVITVLTDLQKTYPFDFYNIVDVKTVSGDSTDFIDHYHPTDGGQQKIIRVILHDSNLGNDSNVF